MAWTVFIDGKEGTTGLRIFDRLAERGEFSLLTLPEEKRKDADARREAIHAADIAILCLPDAAARESVALAEGSNTRILDTSTAHRVAPGWAYGFPELSRSIGLPSSPGNTSPCRAATPAGSLHSPRRWSPRG